MVPCALFSPLNGACLSWTPNFQSKRLVSNSWTTFCARKKVFPGFCKTDLRRFYILFLLSGIEEHLCSIRVRILSEGGEGNIFDRQHLERLGSYSFLSCLKRSAWSTCAQCSVNNIGIWLAVTTQTWKSMNTTELSFRHRYATVSPLFRHRFATVSPLFRNRFATVLQKCESENIFF